MTPIYLNITSKSFIKEFVHGSIYVRKVSGHLFRVNVVIPSIRVHNKGISTLAISNTSQLGLHRHSGLCCTFNGPFIDISNEQNSNYESNRYTLILNYTGYKLTKLTLLLYIELVHCSMRIP